jgi:hypothetical protein
MSKKVEYDALYAYGNCVRDDECETPPLGVRIRTISTDPEKILDAIGDDMKCGVVCYKAFKNKSSKYNYNKFVEMRRLCRRGKVSSYLLLLRLNEVAENFYTYVSADGKYVIN